MKVLVVLLAAIGSILGNNNSKIFEWITLINNLFTAARKELGYNELPGVLAKQNALRPFGSRIVGGIPIDYNQK